MLLDCKNASPAFDDLPAEIRDKASTMERAAMCDYIASNA